MSAGPTQVPPVATEATPYIGLRPFEREEQHLFFGRLRDAQLLEDKILSSRVTVLYAQSGLGKSSLLRALVAPRLEDDGQVVVYFDAWSQEEPLRALKEVLGWRAEALGVPDAASGAPTLTELARLIGTVTEQGLVLVLDQFEEFLVNHGRRLDPLRKELAALVKARAVEAHVVLALREEFLAALQPFRQEILDLFQSTYRLEGLSDEGLREAIVRPAELCGGGCDAALVEALARDLRLEEHEERPGEATSASVELPMLQLVCARLWDAATAAGDRHLTEARYRASGAAEQILADYVRTVMPTRWREKRIVARLMQLLAPPSGLKMSYSAADLASTTALGLESVREMLDRLAGARILRTREYRTGTRYELQHDAFIRVVEPWRDGVLRRAHRRRVASWVLGTAAVVALVTGGVWYLRLLQEKSESRLRLAQEQDESRLLLERQRAEAEADQAEAEQAAVDRWLAGDALQELRGAADEENEGKRGSRFDMLAGYLLWPREGEARLDELVRALESNQDLLPGRYGLVTSGAEEIVNPGPEWPLALTFASDRAIDAPLLGLEWRRLARLIGTQWGIPVPLSLRVLLGEDLTGDDVLVTAPGVEPVTFALPREEGGALLYVPEAGLEDPARACFERFGTDWPLLHAQTTSRIVPRWTLPVWRVTGYEAASGSAITAFRVLRHLLDEPEPLLSPAATRHLLRRVATERPQTVAEARAARGERLGGDLAARVRAGGSIVRPAELFDVVAERWEDASSTIAERWQAEGFLVAQAFLPDRLHGPWGPEASLGGEEEGEAYRGLEGLLPVVGQPIRVEVGATLGTTWFEGDVLKDDLIQAIETARDEIHRRYGVVMPGIRFRGEDAPGDLSPGAFRVELFDQDDTNDDARPVDPPLEQSLARLTRELAYRAAYWRIHWMTAEAVQGLKDELHPALQRWLDERYSLTDLKLLLRAVLAPDAAEAAGFAALLSSDANLPEPGDVGRTVRHASWLLPALVFYATAESPLAGPALRDHLQTLQRRREALGTDPAAQALRPSVPDLVRAGVDDLQRGRVVEAQTAFEKALKTDRPSALEGFLTSWTERVGDVWLEDFGRSVTSLDLATLDRRERLDLEHLIAALGDERFTATRHRLLLALLAAEGDQLGARKQEILRTLLARPEVADEMPPAWAGWLGMAALKAYDPRQAEGLWLPRTTDFLVSAVQRMDDEDAYAIVSDLLAVWRGPTGGRWCRAVLERLAEAKPDTVKPSIPLELALQLAYTQEREALERALAILESERGKLSSPVFSAEDLAYRQAVLAFTQAKALTALAGTGDEARWPEAEAAWRLLLDAIVGSWAEDAHVELAEVLMVLERYDEADELLTAALARWPSRAALHALRLGVALRRGDAAAAGRAAGEVVTAVGEEEAEAWYLAALGQVMTGRGPGDEAVRTFWEKEHWGRGYVAMIARAMGREPLASEADAFLRRHWEGLKAGQERLAERLADGDGGAWVERLYGVVLGEVDRQEVLRPLRDEASFAASPFAALRVQRRAFLCEAWFADAMRAFAAGDEEGGRASLQRAVASGQRTYIDYGLALYLLRTGR